MRPASASLVPAGDSPWTVITPAPCNDAASDSAIPAPNQSSVAIPLMLANGRMATVPSSAAPAPCAAAGRGAEPAAISSKAVAPMLASRAIPVLPAAVTATPILKKT